MSRNKSAKNGQKKVIRNRVVKEFCRELNIRLEEEDNYKTIATAAVEKAKSGEFNQIRYVLEFAELIDLNEKAEAHEQKQNILLEWANDAEWPGESKENNGGNGPGQPRARGWESNCGDESGLSRGGCAARCKGAGCKHEGPKPTMPESADSGFTETRGRARIAGTGASCGSGIFAAAIWLGCVVCDLNPIADNSKKQYPCVHALLCAGRTIFCPWREEGIDVQMLKLLVWNRQRKRISNGRRPEAVYESGSETVYEAATGSCRRTLRRRARLAPWLLPCLAWFTLGVPAFGQGVTTTTVQGTVYTASGQPASGTVQISWPAFTTASGQAIAAGRTSISIGADGFLSTNLAPNAGSTPAGLYYTASYHLSDGTANTEYWTVPAAAQATIGQVRAQLMPAAQAIQAVSKSYVDQAVSQATQSELSVSGGSLTGTALSQRRSHHSDAGRGQALRRFGVFAGAAAERRHAFRACHGNAHRRHLPGRPASRLRLRS